MTAPVLPDIMAVVICKNEPITSVVVNGVQLVPTIPFVPPIGITGGGLFTGNPQPPYLASITITPGSLTINDSLEHSLQINGFDQNSNPFPTAGAGTPTWSTNNNNVPVTAGGDVSAIAASQLATISVSIPNGGSNGQTTLTASISVSSSAISPTKVNIVPSPISVAATATVTPTYTTVDQFSAPIGGVTYLYSSSNTNVFTVNASGVITGVGTYPPVGVSVNPNYENEANYDLNWQFMKNGGVGTSEITFNWKYLFPDSSNPSTTVSPTNIIANFTATDAEVSKAYAQGTHWCPYFFRADNSNLPNWATQVITSDATARQAVSTMVTNLFGRYHSAPGFGDFYMINCVNEALLGGSFQSNILRTFYTSPDSYTTGVIADILTKVHAAQPGAILQLNFGHTEYDATQRTAITTLVAGLNTAGTLAGITLDIGCEWHLDATKGGPDAAWVTWANNLWTTYGVSVSITECDVTDNTQQMVLPTGLASWQTIGAINLGINSGSLFETSSSGILKDQSKITLAGQVFTQQGDSTPFSGTTTPITISPTPAVLIPANTPVTAYVGPASTITARDATKKATLIAAFQTAFQATKLRYFRFWQLDNTDSWIVKNNLFPRIDSQVQRPCLTDNYNESPGWDALVQYWPIFPATPANMRTMTLGTATGTATLTATASDGAVGTATVNVQAAPVLTKLTVTPNPVTITGTNVTLQLQVTGTDQYNNPYTAFTPLYTSSDNNIATVQPNGLLTSVAIGSCTITISSATGAAPPIQTVITVKQKATGGNNMPAGSKIVVQTGHITTNPPTPTGLGNFSMFSPATPASTGEWAGNLTLVPSPGTGLRVNYPTTFGSGAGSGASPVRFGWGFPAANAGTGTCYFGALIQFSTNFAFPVDSSGTVHGIKMFEPRVATQTGNGTGPTENHIIPITFAFTGPPTNLSTQSTRFGHTYPGAGLQGPNGQAANVVENQATALNLADANQHFLEYVCVQDTNPIGGKNGTFQMWMDGTLINSYVGNVNFIAAGNTPGWYYFLCDPVYGALSVLNANGGYWAFDQLVFATL